MPDAGARAEVYAERKQEMVVELIEAGEFARLPGRAALRARREGRGAPAGGGVVVEERRADARADPRLDDSDRACATSSTADLSGRDVAHGKPDPEIFLAAGEALGLPPARVLRGRGRRRRHRGRQVGRHGGAGVARADDAELLAAAGADLVVTTLDDVDLDLLAEGRLAVRSARSG